MCVFCQERYLGELCDGDVPSFSSPERSKILEIFPYPQIILDVQCARCPQRKIFFTPIWENWENRCPQSVLSLTTHPPSCEGS